MRSRAHEDAFATTLSRYSPILYGMALRKLGNAEDAEDALQDAFLSALKHMRQFRGEARLSTWLASIVLNSARMQLRRKVCCRVVSLDENHGEGGPDSFQDSGPDPEETLRRTQIHRILEQSVEKLPVRVRATFRLRVFDGLSTREAAATLGISQGTLKARYFRARWLIARLMRKALEDRRRNTVARIVRPT